MIGPRYYIWGPDTSNPKAMCFTRGGTDLAGMETYDDLKGTPISSWNPRVSFTVAGSEAQGFLGLGWPIISSRLKSLVESAGLTGYEFHPVRVYHVKGREVGRYWYINVLKISDALDLDLATYTYIQPQKKPIIVVIKPALIGPKLGGRDFLRIEESLPSVFVSQRFVDLYREHGCTGLAFKEVPVSW